MHAATEAAIPGPAYGLWQDRRPAGPADSLAILRPKAASVPWTDGILFAAAVVLTLVAFAMMLHAAPGACEPPGGPALLGPCRPG